jgi:hypothetical protein
MAGCGLKQVGSDAKGVRRGVPTQAEHEKVWGFEGLPLESPLLCPISGQQHESAAAGRRSFLQAVGRAGYFGLLQSVKMMVVTGGRASAPRTSFCVLKV